MSVNQSWLDPYIQQSEVLEAFDRDGGWNRKYIGDIEITVTAADGSKEVIQVPLKSGGNPRSVDISAGVVQIEKDGREVRVHGKFTLYQLQDLIHDAVLPARWFYEISGETIQCWDGEHVASSKIIKQSVCLICGQSLKLNDCDECGTPQWFEVGGRKQGKVHDCSGNPHHNFRN